MNDIYNNVSVKEAQIHLAVCAKLLSTNGQRQQTLGTRCLTIDFVRERFSGLWEHTQLYLCVRLCVGVCVYVSRVCYCVCECERIREYASLPNNKTSHDSWGKYWSIYVRVGEWVRTRWGEMTVVLPKAGRKKRITRSLTNQKSDGDSFGLILVDRNIMRRQSATETTNSLP